MLASLWRFYFCFLFSYFVCRLWRKEEDGRTVGAVDIGTARRGRLYRLSVFISGAARRRSHGPGGRRIRLAPSPLFIRYLQFPSFFFFSFFLLISFSFVIIFLCWPIFFLSIL